MERHKAAEVEMAARFQQLGWVADKPFAFHWGSDAWVKWATIAHALKRLGVEEGATVLDVGCGSGWTTALLAEAGLPATGLDIAPAYLDMARERAGRWGVPAEFVEGDMEGFDLGRTFDAVLVYDALHHSPHPARVVANVAAHLRPGGWALFGEPSWLHEVSPGAWKVHREYGWEERGVLVRRLRRDCRAAGLTQFRRFFEGTRPYDGRLLGFVWQAVRLAAANAAFAPQSSVWLAARRR
jgi:2-polyprenyl-3-methyl-5-hydroxy-6-metoxy-1,4-benzoquinol methylase